MCLCAIKTKHYSCSAYLSSVSWAIILGLRLRPVRLCWYYANFVSGPVYTEYYSVLFLGSMTSHMTKGRQIWPPPRAAKGPATPLQRASMKEATTTFCHRKVWQSMIRPDHWIELEVCSSHSFDTDGWVGAHHILDSNDKNFCMVCISEDST